jgi:pyruvate dehydrogenase E1 component alpha subunit
LAKSVGKNAATAQADDNFELRSLQRAYEQSPQFEASNEQLQAFYEQMVLIRRFEEKAGQLYGLGLIGGFCHLYIGQEAVAVGLQSALQVGKDSVITGYRDHGHMLAYGIDPKLIMAELTGRQAGISKGKGGSMHMFSVEHKFFGGHGIVGAQVPLGTGLAFGHKYNEDGGVCVAYFGDGAANQGQVYESFNMAELWKLPVIYAIENNGYAMGTSVARSASEDQFYKRGESFRIPGIQVDGMDPRGQGADHPRADDLPLSRPLDVRSGKVPHPRGGPELSRGARPDRACRQGTASHGDD